MKENVIFYFSGTGNSLQVARDLANEVTNCKVINIAEFHESEIINAERVGIVFPTYFWGVPNIIKKFFSEVQLGKESYIYAIATCGGTPGAALYQINDMLKMQGKRLDAGFFIIMPENYIVSYNVNSPEKQAILFEKEKEKIQRIDKIVTNKERRPFENSKYFFDRLLGKKVNEFVVKKYPTKDKGFVVSDTCTGCGRCAKACSMKNVKIVEGKPEWQHHCEFCMGCLQSCPKNAINWKNKTQKRKRYMNPNIFARANVIIGQKD